tara:strand:- start:207 stop:533 length:327 start_codon:yes stop_codon:yes gene_type:complete
MEYDWYEGEHGEFLIGKSIDPREFKKDLLKAKGFAESLIGKKAEDNHLGKGYRVECLPEFYEQILWYLTEKLGYIYCNYDGDTIYNVDEENGIKLTIYKNKICKEKIH